MERIGGMYPGSRRIAKEPDKLLNPTRLVGFPDLFKEALI
jgi:hypothetical protein